MNMAVQLIRRRKLVEEAVRQYTICNACRYCESYCPVWPLLHSKPLVKHNEVLVLANLCYDHRDCYYACPYTTPHEFSINIPRINREIRLETYSELTFNLTKRWWGWTIIALLFTPIILMWVIYWYNIYTQGPISFYKLIPKNVIVTAGLVTLAYLVSWIAWFLFKFDRLVGPEYRPSFSSIWSTIIDLLLHRWFSNMHYPRDYESNARLLYHLLIFYGFALDLLATIIGAIYEDVLHILSPFPITNPAVITGVTGGFMILTGSLFALYTRYVSVRNQRFIEFSVIDMALVVELLLVALTGLLVLTFRLIGEAQIMYLTLLIHYTLINMLFITRH